MPITQSQGGIQLQNNNSSIISAAQMPQNKSMISVTPKQNNFNADLLNRETDASREVDDDSDNITLNIQEQKQVKASIFEDVEELETPLIKMSSSLPYQQTPILKGNSVLVADKDTDSDNRNGGEDSEFERRSDSEAQKFETNEEQHQRPSIEVFDEDYSDGTSNQYKKMKASQDNLNQNLAVEEVKQSHTEIANEKQQHFSQTLPSKTVSFKPSLVEDASENSNTGFQITRQSRVGTILARA